MKVVPYKNPSLNNEKDKSPSLTPADESLIVQKAKSGILEAGEESIDPVKLQLDHETFPDLKEDREGDKVVLVLVGHVESYDKESCVVELDRASVVHGKLPPLGSGERFKKLESELSNKPGVTNPAGLAAYIGRAKFGAKKFNALSRRGR